MGEGRAARKAGGALRYAAVRYRNAARTAWQRGGTPLKDAAVAWRPLWLKWRGSLGQTHLPDSPAQTRLGEMFQASNRFGFALSQGNRSHTLAGGILTAAERLRRKDCTPMPWQKTGAAAPAE